VLSADVSTCRCRSADFLESADNFLVENFLVTAIRHEKAVINLDAVTR